jgi:presenilin-like A22 family membrane protease
MKHTAKITFIILAMFLITQFIGLYVVDYYSQERVVNGGVMQIGNPNPLPYGLETTYEDSNQNQELNFFSILISFLFAILVLSLLMRIKSKFIIRLWFFVVTILALGISLNAILPNFQFGFFNTSIFALAIGLFLAIGKVYKRDMLFHNFSELLIYPGIAAIFVLMLNLTWTIVLLILISIYDMWAVWKSGIMQKMAKFQMDELKIFSGFFVPYISEKVRKQLSKIKKSKK